MKQHGQFLIEDGQFAEARPAPTPAHPSERAGEVGQAKTSQAAQREHIQAFPLQFGAQERLVVGGADPFKDPAVIRPQAAAELHPYA